MATAAGQSEIKNPKTGMSHAVMKDTSAIILRNW